MSNLKIYLTRHGQDEDNRSGILNGRRDRPLTKVGVKQAEELASKIKKTGIKFKKIFSSPLQRAYRTAEIIAKTLNLSPPQKLDLLIERDFGVMTGQPLTKIPEICHPHILKTDKINYFLSPKGAETFPQLIARAKQLLEYLEKTNKKDEILLVTHGDFGKMIHTAYYELDWKKALKMFHFGNSDLILLSKNRNPEKAHVFQTRQYNA